MKLINKTLKIPFYFYRIIRDFIYCNIALGKWDYTWRFHGTPIIQRSKNSRILIGQKFVACSNPKNNSIGVFQKVILKTCAENAKIIIGNNVGISGAVISAMCSIKIGNNVLIGSGVLITDNDAHGIAVQHRNNPSKTIFKEVIIEDSVFIGARSIILKGVKIGKGAVIGAGSVVSKNIPEYSICAGNPAKIIGDVRDEKYS